MQGGRSGGSNVGGNIPCDWGAGPSLTRVMDFIKSVCPSKDYLDQSGTSYCWIVSVIILLSPIPILPKL